MGLHEVAEFEQDLASNLRRLRKLLSKNGGWFDRVPIGTAYAVPKRLRTQEPDSASVNRIGRSAGQPASGGLDLQLRLRPTPEFAIVEILFFWKYGRFLESVLSPSSIGYRLDLRGEQVPKNRRWVFEYWRRRYQEFRTQPLAAALKELSTARGSVVIVTADLKSFYDTIDPSFLIQPSFVKALKVHGLSGRDIKAYRTAAGSLLGAYSEFRRDAASKLGVEVTNGIPIGALTSRVVANLALATLDHAVATQPDVLCYRRYVDDFVVIGRARVRDRDEFDQLLLRYVPHLRLLDDNFEFDSEALDRPGSKFQLQRKKVRVHHVSGVQGEDFVKAIARDFQSLVSEGRAFLDPTVLGDADTGKLVGVTKADGSPLRVLRDADRTKLQHFALSIGLRSLEQVSLLVDAEEAPAAVRSALRRLARFVRDEGQWVENLELAFRLLGLALGSRSWATVNALSRWMDKTWSTVPRLKRSAVKLYYLDTEVSKSSAWKSMRDFLQERRAETISSNLRPVPARAIPAWLSVTSANSIEVRRTAFASRARLLAAVDLRARDREDDKFDLGGQAEPWSGRPRVRSRSLLQQLSSIRDFTDMCAEMGDKPWAVDPLRLLLSTRPPSYFDIARRWLYRTEEEGFRSDVFDGLLRVVNAIRGTAYTDPVGRVDERETVEVPIKDLLLDTEIDPRVILGNLSLEHEYFKAAATRVSGSITGRPALTVRRLVGLAGVLDRARSVATKRGAGRSTPPSVLLLPELALPRAWFRATANYAIRTGGFGLVVGLEYLHDQLTRTVLNQAYAVLPGPLNSVATWPFTKHMPAREEARMLAELPIPVSFPTPIPRSKPRAVVDSPYGRFSVLVCSEMVEARLAADLLGRVELLLAPSWNTDTASYDHLIQSLGLQLHAVVAVANNGHYSDCRVWAPLTERWQRDLCRLIERDIDDVVFVDIPLRSLREWHSVGGREFVQPQRRISLPKWRPLPPEWP